MKALRKIFPVKKLTFIQNIVCVSVVFAMLLLSFGTVFTATVTKDEKTTRLFDRVIAKYDISKSDAPEDKAELPETIKVGAAYIIKSTISACDVVIKTNDAKKEARELAKAEKNAAMEGNKASTSNSTNKNATTTEGGTESATESETTDLEAKAELVKQKKAKVGEAVRGEGFVGLIALILAIYQAFRQSVILGIIYCLLIAASIVLPIIFLIKFIIGLVRLLKNRNNPEKACYKITKGLRSTFKIFPLLWIFKIIEPQVTFGISIILMCVLCALAFVFHLAASRLKEYTPEELAYLNVLQSIALVSVIGYIMFILGFTNSHMFAHILKDMGAMLSRSGIISIILTSILAITIVLVMIMTVVHITKLASRLCCMVSARKKLVRYRYLKSAILSLVLISSPIFLIEGSLALKLEKDLFAFIISSLGIAIMLACEIALPLFKKSFCPDTTPAEVHSVLTGTSWGIRPEEYEKQPTEENSEDTAEAVTEEVATEAVEEVVEEETVEEETEEATDEVTEETVDEIIEEATGEIIEEVVEETIEEQEKQIEE